MAAQFTNLLNRQAFSIGNVEIILLREFANSITSFFSCFVITNIL
jgi:hypothetical protein